MAGSLRAGVRRLRLTLLCALVACSGSPDPCSEPTYEGAATDEAWRTMVDGEDRAQVSATNAATFTLPAEGQEFAKDDPPPRFAWASPLAQSRVSPRTPFAQAGPAHTWRSFGDRLLSLFVGTAYAHLPPVTGDLYYLQIDVPGRTCPLRVLTTNLYWQVDDPSWALLRAAAGQTISVRILSAYLTENRISEGPYQPALPRTFKVK